MPPPKYSILGDIKIKQGSQFGLENLQLCSSFHPERDSREFILIKKIYNPPRANVTINIERYRCKGLSNLDIVELNHG
jgi:hypothetical protein